MSTITLSDIGKRFRYEWIFQNINLTFENGQRCAILGPNGVGKSTLMKILSGHLSPSAGTIRFEIGSKNIDIDAVYRHISYAAPYIEMIEELNLTEAIAFHTRFHPLSKTLTTNDLIQILGFEKSRHKEIRYFSSGMRQRLKLALAICSDSPFLLLDEPTTNLDAQGVAWYRDLMSAYTEGGQRLVVIASNIAHDYDFCEQTLNILDYK